MQSGQHACRRHTGAVGFTGSWCAVVFAGPRELLGRMAVPFGDGENLQPNDRDVGRSRASRESLSAAMRRSAQVPVLPAAPQFSGHIRPTGVPRHAQRRAPTFF